LGNWELELSSPVTGFPHSLKNEKGEGNEEKEEE